jgi:hypothetical protein
VTGEEDHEIWNAAMINVWISGGICAACRAIPFPRIRRKVAGHVFVDFFLQINADGAIGPDHFIGADSGGRWDVSSRIRDANVGGIIADGVMSSFDGGSYQAVKDALCLTAESIL